MELNGLILAGGQSTRMGEDKSLIEFHGLPQRQYLFNLLKKFCGDVFTSCKTPSSVPAELNPLADRFPIRGPFNGILSAFETDSSLPWICVPIDMPYIDEKAISHLIASRKPGTMATCFLDSEGLLPEPLFTLWETVSYPALREFYAQGKTRPREFLMTHPVNVIPSPFPNIHVNINSKEDLKKFRNDYSS